MTRIIALCLAMLVQSGYSAPGNTTITTVETTRNSSSTSPLMTTPTNESTTTFGDLNNNEAPFSTPLPPAVSQSLNQSTTNVNSTASSSHGTTPMPQPTTKTTTTTTSRPANQTYDTKMAPANVTTPQFDHAVETTVDHPKNINTEPPSLNNTAKDRGLNTKKQNETRIVNEKARIAFKKGTIVFFSGMCGPQGCMVGETADEVLVPVVEVARSKQ